MKILHVTNNYPYDDKPFFGIFVHRQIESLRKEGIQCEVFFINSRKYGLKEYVRSYFRFLRFDKHDYDLVHCHHSWSALLVMLSCFVSRPVVLSFQNEPKREIGYFLRLLLRLYCIQIIVKAKFKSIPLQYKVLPNGVEIPKILISREEAKRRLNLRTDLKYCLFVDSHDRRSQKRRDRFLEVMKLLGDDFSPLICTNVDPEEMWLYYHASHVYLLTSDFEGSPNAVKEMLVRGGWVVSTPVGDTGELQKLFPRLLISADFSPDKLANLVVRLETNEEVDLYFEDIKISTESVAKELKKIYENSINRVSIKV